MILGKFQIVTGSKGKRAIRTKPNGYFTCKINIFVITSSDSSPTFEKSYQLLHADSEHLFGTVSELEEAEKSK